MPSKLDQIEVSFEDPSGCDYNSGFDFVGIIEVLAIDIVEELVVDMVEVLVADMELELEPEPKLPVDKT